MQTVSAYLAIVPMNGIGRGATTSDNFYIP